VALNIYNATMIQAVLDHAAGAQTGKSTKWQPSANEFAVFKEKRVRLNAEFGEAVSRYKITYLEHSWQLTQKSTKS